MTFRHVKAKKGGDRENLDKRKEIMEKSFDKIKRCSARVIFSLLKGLGR
jgi:hypothetical protein